MPATPETPETTAPKRRRSAAPTTPETPPEPATAPATDGPIFTTDGAGDPPDDLHSFRAVEIDGDGAPPGVIEADEAGDFPDPDAAPVERIGKAAFWEVFQIAFALPGQVAPKYRPVAIQPDEKPQARAASDAVYRLLEIYAPGFLAPQSETLGLVIVAAPFVGAKVALAWQIARTPPAPMASPGAAQAGGDAGADTDEGRGLPDATHLFGGRA